MSGTGRENRRGRRALLAGHFSTVGDIESLHLVCAWLDTLSLGYDIAPFPASVRANMPGSIDPSHADPHAYSHLVVICGPVWPELLRDVGLDLEKYVHATKIGINLTMVLPMAEWNPFDVLFERDSDRTTRPDLTFLGTTKTMPVVGRCMVKNQSSYADRQHHGRAHAAFDTLIRQRGLAAVDLDTRWYREANGLRTPAAFLSAVKRVDVLLTNRLHGMVYALRAGVPVIAIDAISGGGKLSAQADAIGWLECLTLEDISDDRLSRALDWSLSTEGRLAAQLCGSAVQTQLETLQDDFVSGLQAAALTQA